MTKDMVHAMYDACPVCQPDDYLQPSLALRVREAKKRKIAEESFEWDVPLDADQLRLVELQQSAKNGETELAIRVSFFLVFMEKHFQRDESHQNAVSPYALNLMYETACKQADGHQSIYAI
jgi:hypothetical protein